MDNTVKATGSVVEAFANLLHIRFEGHIRQGELVKVKVADAALLGEVIEIEGTVAKVQVFEDTRGVKFNTPVEFLDHLLEAELGPGLLTSIFDGLQNPLEKVAIQTGVYLTRGVYITPLDREKHWDFQPSAKIGDVLTRGDFLGSVKEGRFDHQIMVPFSFFGKVKITSVTKAGSYTIDTVVAKGEDEEGHLLEFTMVQRWAVKNPLMAGKKIPFGAGKTVMQHHLSKYSAVDIVIIVACGERAGEVVEVLKTFPTLPDPQFSNEPLMKRTVIICNTSSMPVASREASVYMGATIAEYFRQMGLDVLLLADSTSRWAQAMREMSGRLEELPGEEAFPAYLASRISAFYERAGVIRLKNGKTGSMTLGGSVSPAGGNFSEPVTQASLSIVGAFYGLSRARSDARRYPAIDPLISWTKYLEQVGQDIEPRFQGWVPKVLSSLQILRASDEIGKRMEVVGEEGIAIDDMMTYLKGELYEFSYLQQNAFDAEDAYTPFDRQMEMFSLIQKIFDAHLEFETHHAARKFFLNLQNELKNINFLPFRSEKYKEAIEEIEKKIGVKEHA